MAFAGTPDHTTYLRTRAVSRYLGTSITHGVATINQLGVVLSTVNQKLSDIHYIRGIHWNNIWIRPIYTAYARPGLYGFILVYTAYARPGLLLTGRRPFFYGPGREAVNGLLKKETPFFAVRGLFDECHQHSLSLADILLNMYLYHQDTAPQTPLAVISL